MRIKVVLGNRVGGRVTPTPTPTVLSHRSTCCSAYGGSKHTGNVAGCPAAKPNPSASNWRWMGQVHMACSDVRPRATSVACRPDCICIFQAAAYHSGADIQSAGNDRLNPHREVGIHRLNGLLSFSSSIYCSTPPASRCRNSSTALENCGWASQCADQVVLGKNPRASLCSP